MLSAHNQHVQQLFDGIAEQYDLLAEAFSFFQNGRWRSFLVSRLQVSSKERVMDLCTGTGSVAVEIAQNSDCVVVGVDLSREMLVRARKKILRSGLEDRIPLLMGTAECLPFPNGCFDAVCFTYLLRYVEDPEATMKEIVRVLKPQGRLVSLEFGVPQNSVARGLWYVYTRGFLPLTARFISYQWHEVALFLGRSISGLHRSYSVERIRQTWSDLGTRDVEVKRLSFGAAVVMWGTREVERNLKIRVP